MPRYAPTSGAQVEILHSEPARAHDKLGEIVVDASIDPPPAVEKSEAALRREAAKLGADALVIVHDRAQAVGAQVWGPWWAPSVSTIENRLIVGVAIKYK